MKYVDVVRDPDEAPKYPHLFCTGDMVLINKLDLLPYIRFDVARCIDHVRQTEPAQRVMLLSAETGEGMSAWYDWLSAQPTRAIGPA